MVTDKLRPETDTILQPYFNAQHADEAERLLAELVVEQAEPIIRQIVEFKLRVWSGRADHTRENQDCEDVCQDVVIQIIARLSQNKVNFELEGIRNFRSYIAVTSYRACHDYLRLKYPQRYSLKHKLRYVLTHHPELALWETEKKEFVGGLCQWREQKGSNSSAQVDIVQTKKLQQLLSNPQDFAAEFSPQGLRLGDLLGKFFNWILVPVELDELTGIIAALTNTKDKLIAPETVDEAGHQTLADVADVRVNIATEVEQKIYLQSLWREICQLSAQHCAALLLNLKDAQGGSAINLFLFTGVTTFLQIAKVLGLTEMSLAQLWNGLPLDDLTIAERLGVTRQQVINFRKSARERLARRMKSIGF